MIFYQTKAEGLTGSSYGEVLHQARKIFRQIEQKTKRKPYIRSAYFKKEKIFFDFFWMHLMQKSPRERFERLKYFFAAIELIKNSRNKPTVKPNPNNKNEILYRFYGVTKNKEKFVAQIKENKNNKKKNLMSCFCEH